jgi:hypothetical protein
MAVCDDCGGTRSTPDIFGDLGPFLSCVLGSDDVETWVVLRADDEA